jgi:hypothetical protein
LSRYCLVRFTIAEQQKQSKFLAQLFRRNPLEDIMSRTTASLIALSLISTPAVAGQLGPAGQSVAINITNATTTQLVAPSGSTPIYVTAWDVLASSASGFALEYGTKTTNPCDTGAKALTGAYSFVAQSGLSRSGGPQPLYVIPQGNALCAATSGVSVSLAGSLSYTQY